MDNRIKNLGDRANTAGFDKNPQNINKKGRPPSIRKQLRDLLELDGSITIPPNQVVQVNGDGSVILDLPTQMQVAIKLSSWAMSENGNDSLRAIKMIMEQIDGKPTQALNHTTKGEPLYTKIDYSKLSDSALEELESLLNEEQED